ncbi:MAG: inositol-3-phosphate synthase [Candidatus Omnitrophica bacterium]|nr:inositol-3-phosphate synthase [Candidatus Omnitrophota bacterium]
MSEIKVAIAGVGNCTNSLVQGRFYYEDKEQTLKNKTTFPPSLDGRGRGEGEREIIPGLMHPVLGGYKVTDIVPVVAFDVDKRKVGKDLSEAIWASPNCTKKFSEVPHLGVKVLMGPVLDGVTEHLKRYVEVSSEKEIDNVDKVAQILKDNRADALVINLPTASEKAAWFYAEAAFKAKAGIVNGIPVLIANDKVFAKKAEKNKVPIVGDDYKSQLGGTILDRDLLNLCIQRGIKITKSYQLNYGGNTDFWNLTDYSRGKTKHASKKRGVDSVMTYPAPFSVNVSHLEVLNDDKICRIEIWGENFGGTPIKLEAKLHVVDSPNSAGVMVDAIRCCKLALDRGIGGVLESASSYLMKSTPKQYSSEERARKAMDEWIKGKRGE